MRSAVFRVGLEAVAHYSMGDKHTVLVLGGLEGQRPSKRTLWFSHRSMGGCAAHTTVRER
jgi:hypothetical protein